MVPVLHFNLRLMIKDREPRVLLLFLLLYRTAFTFKEGINATPPLNGVVLNVLKLECTLAYSVKSTLLTLHILLENLKYLCPTQFTTVPFKPFFSSCNNVENNNVWYLGTTKRALNWYIKSTLNKIFTST